MSDGEFKLFIAGWLIIIVFLIGRHFYQKNQIAKQNLKTQKTTEKFYSILSEVEKLKRDKKNKK